MLGRIGSGITHKLTGAYLMLTGCDTSGRQLSGFGSSEGILKEQLFFGKAGSPNIDDFIITMEEIDNLGISAVGLKFIGKQAKFVVENEHTNMVIDINKKQVLKQK